MRLNIKDVKMEGDPTPQIVWDIVKALVFQAMVGKDAADDCRVYNVLDRSKVRSKAKVARKIERLVPEADPQALRSVVWCYYDWFTDHWNRLDRDMNPPEMDPVFNPGPSFDPDDYQEDC